MSKLDGLDYLHFVSVDIRFHPKTVRPNQAHQAKQIEPARVITARLLEHERLLHYHVRNHILYGKFLMGIFHISTFEVSIDLL